MSDGHNGPSGPMPEVTVIDPSKWPTLHTMTEKGKAMYDIFCAARTEARQTEEVQAHVAEFIEAGKEQGDKMTEIMEQAAKGGLTG